MKSLNKILVSNGHSKFFLAKIFKYYEKEFNNSLLICSFYPKQNYYKLIPSYLNKFLIIQRFYSRKENIKNEKNIHNIILSEFFHQIAVYFFKKNNSWIISHYFAYIAMLYYRISVFFKLLFLNDIKVYHFRSGYGGLSLKLAKIKKIYTICDHSFVNPQIFDSLIKENGVLSENLIKNINFYWKPVYFDIINSDLVLCNSNFVEKSIKLYNENINSKVLYWGFDSDYFSLLENNSIRQNEVLTILFIGTFEKRKGADAIIYALKKLKIDFKFHILGNIDNYYKSLLPKNCYLHGYVSQKICAEYLSHSDIFLFPTLAEGSARVIYMAMAAGCYVITTENAGSIIENDITGKIIRCNDHESIVYELSNFKYNNNEILKIRNNAKKAAFHYKNSEQNYFRELSKLIHGVI